MRELPRGWTWTTLGLLIDGFEAGRNLRATGRMAGTTEFGVLKISAVSWGTFKPEENKALLPGDAPRAREIVRKGDLLISRANTSELVGAAVLVGDDHPRLMLPDKILRLRVRSAIVEPALLLQVLRLPRVREHFEANATGTSDSMRNLSQPKIEAATVPLPPLNEQRRIVAKLEALQSRSRRARAALETVPPLLEKLRQSILAAAFRGDLTKDWRAKNKNVEPATELLKRIRIERRRRCEEAELAKLEAKGKPPTDDRWKAKYREPEPMDTEGLPELPEGWAWASFQELTIMLRGGVSATAQQSPTKHAVLRSSAVRRGAIDYGDVSYLASAGDEESYLHDGDLLFTRLSGTLAYVGNCSIVRNLGAKRVLYPDRIFRATVTERVEKEYVALAFACQGLRTRLEDAAKSSAGHQRISLSDLASFAVPLAPLHEQREVARRLPAMLSVSERVNAVMPEIDAQRVVLETACLARAFRGELVPQDPTDEPADAMLARLRGVVSRQPAKSAKEANTRTRASTRGRA